MRREEVSSYSEYSLAQTLKAKNGNHHWCSREERKHGFWTRNFTGSPSWTGRTNLTFCRHPRKQTAADLPTHVQDSPQRRLEDPQAYPGQIRYIIPSTSSGSALVEPGKPQELLIAAVSTFNHFAELVITGEVTRSYAVLKTKHMWTVRMKSRSAVPQPEQNLMFGLSLSFQHPGLNFSKEAERSDPR